MSGLSKTVNWVIGKGARTLTLSPSSVNVETGDAQVITASYAGTGTLTATSSNPNYATVSVSGNNITVSGVAPGSAVITSSVAENARYEAAAQTANVSVSVHLETITLPSQTGTLTYNGNAQSPVWDSNYDSSKMTLAGVTSRTDAGSYTATFTPKSGYKWSDNTTETKSVLWVIGKASPNFSVSPTTLAMTPGQTKTITVTRNGGGAITAQSSNTSVATTSVSGTAVSVVGASSGSATITITLAATTNYLGGSATVSTSVSSVTMTTVTITNRTLDGASAVPITAYASSGDVTTSINKKSVTLQPQSSFTINAPIGGLLILEYWGEYVQSTGMQVISVGMQIEIPGAYELIGLSDGASFFKITSANPSVIVNLWASF